MYNDVGQLTFMKHILTGIFFHTLLITFGQPSLKITEFMPHPGQPLSLSESVSSPWLEISNVGNLPVATENFQLRISGNESGKTVALKSQTIFPGQSVIFRFQHGAESPANEIPVDITTGTESIYLLDPGNMVIDSLIPHNAVKPNEVWVRNSLTGNWAIYSGNFATPGEQNNVFSNWNKLASTTSLPAADSDPNACLVYKGKIWILGGWTLHPEEQIYSSISYLWNSEDGIHWNKISDSLPFTHYSSFIVFKDTIRVYTNYKIFSSVDGIHWDNLGDVPYEFFGTTSRLAVLNDKLVFVDTAISGYSTNGIDFTFQNHHIPPRNYGRLKTMNGQLYYMGGENIQTGIYYNDVWTSKDGLNWTQLVEHAPWKARKWFMSEVYQDKIWVFGGFNPPLGPFDGLANMNDIWFSEDGANWHPYTPANPWPIRHAAYHTIKDNKIFMIAGYDNGEVNGLFNDVWTFEITNYYLKPGGDINKSNDWSSTRTMDGPGPDYFNKNDIFYHIGSAGYFMFDKPFDGNNITSTLVIGDGVSETTMEILPQSNHLLKTMVSPGSKLILKNLQPEFQIIPQPNSHIVFSDCPKLRLPSVGYAHLTIENSRIIHSDTIGVNGNFAYNQISLTGTNPPDIAVYLSGKLSMGEKSGTGLLQIIGTHSGDQEIYTHNHLETKTGNLEFIKPSGNFILKDPLFVDIPLKIRN